MKYWIYKITTSSGYTYVGQTSDLEKREYTHRYTVAKGKLGARKIPKTIAMSLKVLASCDDFETALILESRYIALDMLARPKRNCNVMIGRSNTFNSDETT